MIEIRRIDTGKVTLHIDAQCLQGAALQGANLRRVWLVGLNLSGACLRGADLRRAALVEADLSGADLSGADLASACLDRANLISANLRNARLGHASLQGANLRGADLRGAAFFAASLAGSHLQGADLRGRALSEGDGSIQGAEFDRHTKWPSGFAPEEHGAIRAAESMATVERRARTARPRGQAGGKR